MKPKFITVIILLIVLSFCEVKVNAQTAGGCDLCGPASGAYKNIASGDFSATIGVGCESRGLYSFSVGYHAKSYMTNAIAMGKFVKAQAVNAMVIGSGIGNESQMLVNRVPNSLMIGFNSCNPTLFVSSSTAFNKTGKVGIGNVISPKAKLHIKSDSDEDAGIIVEPANLTKTAYIQLFNDKNRICVKQGSGLSIISQDSNINFEAGQVLMKGKVAINTSRDFSEGYDYALAVSGGILTTKVLVKEVSEWHDYVFEENYDLPSIDEMEHYIAENGHLPDIPSEYSVLTKGYDMVEMDGLLLKKIEELTLYTIELNKIIKSQQEIIDSLQSK